MKKKLTYRDQLLELARIYNVREIQEYIRRRKNLTSGQIELILRKNKIIIPKDFKTNFFRENISKPLSRVSRRIDDLKEDSSKAVSKVSRKISYFKEDSSRSFFGFFYNSWKLIGNAGLGFLSFFSNFFYNSWKLIGNAGLGFLNVIPKLGHTYYSFFADFFTNLFHGIYSQQLNKGKAGRVIVGFFIIVGFITVVVSAVTTFNNFEESSKNEIVKKEKQIQKPKVKAQKEVKKPKVKVQKEVKKPKVKVQKEVKKPKVKSKAKKQEKVAKTILPDLNLKTETVLNLFKDVDYNLNQVRYEKIIKPIYFTQFPKDLDAIQSSKLKKETFIKIVLPLIVAENEKILYDRKKLKKIISQKQTTGQEKQWLRQKFLEYKVKKGGTQELEMRMDIIPNSLALAQAAKESGWGTSRFALEGNAIFGQWTWDGSGIAPLNRDKSKNHKILKFPILRASVKAYQNNLNTHKSYVKFREKRRQLREKKKNLNGLELSKTLSNYAQTGSEYIKILAKIIIQNRLTDFEPVRLAHSVKEKKELNL